MDPELVLIIFEELSEAGPGDVGELDLGFLGGARGEAGFHDVLLSRPRGLDHLVDGAITAAEETLAVGVREIEDDRGLLILETAVESNAPPFSGHFWPPSA